AAAPAIRGGAAAPPAASVLAPRGASVGLRRATGLARGRGLARRDVAALPLAALAPGRRLGRGLALRRRLARGGLLLLAPRRLLALRARGAALAPPRLRLRPRGGAPCHP